MIRRLFSYTLLLLMALFLSSCSEPERMTLPEPETPVRPEQPDNGGADDNETDPDAPGNEPEATPLKLKITVGNRIVTATLRDTPTTRDLLSRLPLDVTLSDYAGAEKIFYPRPALTTEGSPRGNASTRGDLDLYVPWGNIAIFYGGDGGYSNSMIHLGRIDGNGIEALETAGSIAVRIERLNSTARAGQP